MSCSWRRLSPGGAGGSGRLDGAPAAGWRSGRTSQGLMNAPWCAPWLLDGTLRLPLGKRCRFQLLEGSQVLRGMKLRSSDSTSAERRVLSRSSKSNKLLTHSSSSITSGTYD